MSAKELARCKKYADFFAAMQTRHDAFAYRQDLAGFGEPAEGSWDGFQRINTETKTGGMVGVFRHGASETRRQVTISYLAANRFYEVRDMEDAVIVGQSGRDFATKGFEVTLGASYDGRLFEVRAVA